MSTKKSQLIKSKESWWDGYLKRICNFANKVRDVLGIIADVNPVSCVEKPYKRDRCRARSATKASIIIIAPAVNKNTDSFGRRTIEPI